MSSETDPKLNKVELIPWDPTDDKQFKRMYDQRIACGWRADEVSEWKEKSLKGQKFLYWIVLSDSLPNKDQVLSSHFGKYDYEREPLIDTATTIVGTERKPSNNNFFTVGHIALEDIPERNNRFSLPKSTIWIMSLYVSWAVQTGGLGRSAMIQLERLATIAPLNGTMIGLDTISKELQIQDPILRTIYDDRGLERPAVIRTNEEWYQRQGYKVILRENSGYDWKSPVDGETIPLSLVYMIKRVA